MKKELNLMKFEITANDSFNAEFKIDDALDCYEDSGSSLNVSYHEEDANHAGYNQRHTKNFIDRILYQDILKNVDRKIVQNANHHNAVFRMMKAVRGEIESGILERFNNEYDESNKPAKLSKEKCESALEACETYFEMYDDAEDKWDKLKVGFEYLRNKASYDDITTILSIANTIPELKKRTGLVTLVEEKWDLAKLFPEIANKKRLASLTHDCYLYGFRKCLDRTALGLDAFRVFSTEGEKCSGKYWDPFNYKKDDLNQPLLDAKIKMGSEHQKSCQKYTFTTNRDDPHVYYDPEMAANELQHNFFWIKRTWFFFFIGAGVMKQYLDPNDMEYALASLTKFGNGMIFILLGLMMAADSFKYLNVVMTNDGSKLIIPKKEQQAENNINFRNFPRKAMNFFLSAISDLFVTSFIGGGTIAETTVIINTLNQLKSGITDRKKKIAGSLLNLAAMFGLIFFFAAFAFLLAYFNRSGGAFAKFNRTCYQAFPDWGYTDLICYETLASIVMTFWLPGMTEGWKYFWMPMVEFIGGLVWFLPGLLLKVFKVVFIEPQLLLSNYLFSRFFVWAYRKLHKGEMKDDVSLHFWHNITKSILMFFTAISLSFILKWVLMDIFGWRQLYFAEFFPISSGIQAFYYLTDLLPTNNATKLIAPIVAITSGTLSMMNVGLFLVQAGTGGQGAITPYISALDYIWSNLIFFLNISCLAAAVKVVLMKMKLLWYHKETQNKMAYQYMHDFAHAFVDLGLDHNLVPKNEVSWLFVGLFAFYFLGWWGLRLIYHHHFGEGEFY